MLVKRTAERTRAEGFMEGLFLMDSYNSSPCAENKPEDWNRARTRPFMLAFVLSS